jgi:hypothetical protein
MRQLAVIGKIAHRLKKCRRFSPLFAVRGHYDRQCLQDRHVRRGGCETRRCRPRETHEACGWNPLFMQ